MLGQSCSAGTSIQLHSRHTRSPRSPGRRRSFGREQAIDRDGLTALRVEKYAHREIRGAVGAPDELPHSAASTATMRARCFTAEQYTPAFRGVRSRTCAAFSASSKLTHCLTTSRQSEHEYTTEHLLCNRPSHSAFSRYKWWVPTSASSARRGSLNDRQAGQSRHAGSSLIPERERRILLKSLLWLLFECRRCFCALHSSRRARSGRVDRRFVAANQRPRSVRLLPLWYQRRTVTW